MNEDGYVYESKRRPSTANSHLEKSNGTIDLKFWSTNSVHIDTTLRVRSSFHLIPSVHFISLNFIVSHRVFFFFLFFPLSLSLLRSCGSPSLFLRQRSLHFSFSGISFSHGRSSFVVFFLHSAHFTHVSRDASFSS